MPTLTFKTKSNVFKPPLPDLMSDEDTPTLFQRKETGMGLHKMPR